MANRLFRNRTRTCSQCGEVFTPNGPRSFQCSEECRFWSKVNKRGRKMPHMKTRCWEWQKYEERGYGLLRIKGKCIRAHRYSYVINKGPLGNKHALHKCDNPPCVRPSHLFKGDQQANVADCVSKGRVASPKGEKNPKAVFTKKQVKTIIIEAEIIKKSSSSKHPGATTELAKKYGVTQGGMWRIVSGKTWSELNRFRQKIRRMSLRELQALRR